MLKTNHNWKKIPTFSKIRKFHNHHFDVINSTMDNEDIKDYSDGRHPIKNKYQWLRQPSGGNSHNFDIKDFPKSVCYIPTNKEFFIRKNGESGTFGNRRNDPKYSRDYHYFMCFLEEWIGKKIFDVKITKENYNLDSTRHLVEFRTKNALFDIFKTSNPNDHYKT